MASLLRTCVLSLVTILVMCGGVVAEAKAGWLTIKNETGKQVSIQEVVIVNGQTRRGKPTNLLAGDTVREFLPVQTVKQIEVYDAQNPKLPIWSGMLNCKDDTQTFSVALNGGKVTVTPVPVRK